MSWEHHAPLAKQCGVTDDQLARLEGRRRFPPGPPPGDQALCRFTFEFSSFKGVAQETATELLQHFTERQIVDMALISAFYLSAGALIIGFDVELEGQMHCTASRTGAPKAAWGLDQERLRVRCGPQRRSATGALNAERTRCRRRTSILSKYRRHRPLRRHRQFYESQAAKQLGGARQPDAAPGLSHWCAPAMPALPVGRAAGEAGGPGFDALAYLHRLILTDLVQQERQGTTLICRTNYPGDARPARLPGRRGAPTASASRTKAGRRPVFLVWLKLRSFRNWRVVDAMIDARKLASDKRQRSSR